MSLFSAMSFDNILKLNFEITHIPTTNTFQYTYFAYSCGIVTYIEGAGMCFHGKIH